MMFKIAICDDERAVCSEVENILKEIEKNFSIKLDVDVFFQVKKYINLLEMANILISFS